MERIFNEQVGLNSHPAEADIISGDVEKPTSLEKFKNVESLQKAYNSLESEFTKRSQRLRRLEEECAALKAQLGDNLSSGAKSGGAVGTTAEEFFKKYPDAAKYLESPDKLAALKGDGTLENAYIELLTGKLNNLAELSESRDHIISHIDSAMKDEIIRDFLSEISCVKPKQFIVGGETAVTPPLRPKTLSEAKTLAEKYFG